MRAVLFLIAGLLAANAQPAFADAESDARAAEQAGRHREALGLYVKALESTAAGSAQEQRLRDRIIDVAKNVKPAPAVPQEALLRLGRARGFIELAKQPQDYQRPADELRAGLRLAPWWAEGYFNLAVVLEKAEKYGDAIASLKLYARAVDAKEAQSAAVEIARLEAKAEASSPSAKAAREFASVIEDLRGLWVQRYDSPEWAEERMFKADVTAPNRLLLTYTDAIVVRNLRLDGRGSPQPWPKFVISMQVNADQSVNGNFEWTTRWDDCSYTDKGLARGRVSADRRQLELELTMERTRYPNLITCERPSLGGTTTVRHTLRKR